MKTPFKVGDRVIFGGHKGTVVLIDADGYPTEIKYDDGHGPVLKRLVKKVGDTLVINTQNVKDFIAAAMPKPPTAEECIKAAEFLRDSERVEWSGQDIRNGVRPVPPELTFGPREYRFPHEWEFADRINFLLSCERDRRAGK